MKKLILPLLILIASFAHAESWPFAEANPQIPWVDDTNNLNTAFAAGNITLSAGYTYHVSGTLNISHNVNMNGATIVSSITANSVPVVKLNAAAASITNGSITGPWLSTSAPNSSGYYAIRVLADNVIISHVNISGFSSYGIEQTGFNNPTITYCNISNTGYIGYYYNPEANTVGGTFSNNTVDRSMLPATTILEACVEIRASVNSNYTSSGWTITNNTFKMPNMPWSSRNECMEVRRLTASTVVNNVSIQGTIGISVVICAGVSVSNNQCLGNSNEGIEFASSINCYTYNNTANGSFAQGGIFLDGYSVSPASPGNTSIILTGDIITNSLTGGIGIQIGTDNSSINVIAANITAKYEGIDIKQSTTITISSANITGCTYGIFLDTAPGNLTVNGGSITHCTYALYAYNAQTNALVDNIGVYNTSLASTITSISSTFSNGAHFGTNIHFSNYTPVSVSWFNVTVTH